MKIITYEEFEKVELRSSTIIKVEEFTRAKKPAFKIWADFGSKIGILQTSAQVRSSLQCKFACLENKLLGVLIWEKKI